MKARLFLLAATIFAAQLSTAQLLYTEDFESYNTGPFSTDLTGTTPAQGGWHTLSTGVNGTASVDDYKIVVDPTKGNVMKILEGKSFVTGACQFYRTDLNTYWQQRTSGNNVLKLSFDIYTDFGASAVTGNMFYVSLYNKKELLANFHYQSNTRHGSVALPSNRGALGPGSNPMLTVGSLPADSWVTIELYIDYDNNKVYLSVPAINYTVTRDTFFPLDLTGGGDHDDNPVKLEVANGYTSSLSNPLEMSIDNINMSAQGSAPLVSINEFVSSKFNLYPNPATNIVTISNNEHVGINQLMVYDVTGKQISTYSYKDEHEVQVNVDGLNSGIYFLHIVTDEGTGVKKLFKK